MTSDRQAGREADRRFYQAIADVLHCITSDGLYVVPDPLSPRGPSRVLTVQNDPARLRDHEGRPLFLSVEYRYVVQRAAPTGSSVTTLGYIYTVRDAQQRPLLGYHYHP